MQKIVNKNYGFKHEKIAIGKDYVFGSYSPIPREILQLDRNWTPFLPAPENQALSGVEPSDCVTMTTDNCVEILLKKKYSGDYNYSDRFLAQMSGTGDGNGNSPQTVAETLRKIGNVAETVWPFDASVDTFEKFYIKPTAEVIRQARIFVETYDFKHEYVPTSPESLKQALQLSPLGVSVPAWFQNGEGNYYRPEGFRDNHFTTLIGYEDGVAWIVFDSYDKNIKRLVWDIGFEVAKRYYIKKISTVEVIAQPWWIKLLCLIPKMSWKQ